MVQNKRIEATKPCVGGSPKCTGIVTKRKSVAWPKSCSPCARYRLTLRWKIPKTPKYRTHVVRCDTIEQVYALYKKIDKIA